MAVQFGAISLTPNPVDATTQYIISVAVEENFNYAVAAGIDLSVVRGYLAAGKDGNGDVLFGGGGDNGHPEFWYSNGHGKASWEEKNKLH